MYIIFLGVFIILLIVAISFTRVGAFLFEPIQFFIEGKDKGFLFSDLVLLWCTGKYSGLKNKTKLFWSTAALDNSIKFILRQVEYAIDEENAQKTQLLLNRLYAYRTKVALEEAQKIRRLESTKEIKIGQICIIIVPNENTVYGKVVANSKDLLAFALFDASSKRAKKIVWQGKPVRVYFWRQNDAGYIFQSTVINAKNEENRTDLFMHHSKKIVRTQKRKSVRAKCSFQALMFPLKQTEAYTSVYETSGGVRCSLGNISEDGAMFYVRGKACNGVRMKLQFKIHETEIVMCGKIVRFNYEPVTNKSRVHFICEFLDQKMKNIVLSFVYNIATKPSKKFVSNMLNEDESNFDDNKGNL